MSTARFKRMLSMIALLVLFGAVAHAAPVKILALGTSLTEGYGVPPGQDFTAVLQDRLTAAHIDAKIINAGVSGDTSAGGLARLDWSLADHPDAAIVELEFEMRCGRREVAHGGQQVGDRTERRLHGLSSLDERCVVSGSGHHHEPRIRV